MGIHQVACWGGSSDLTFFRDLGETVLRIVLPVIVAALAKELSKPRSKPAAELPIGSKPETASTGTVKVPAEFSLEDSAS